MQGLDCHRCLFEPEYTHIDLYHLICRSHYEDTPSKERVNFTRIDYIPRIEDILSKLDQIVHYNSESLLQRVLQENQTNSDTILERFRYEKNRILEKVEKYLSMHPKLITHMNNYLSIETELHKIRCYLKEMKSKMYGFKTDARYAYIPGKRIISSIDNLHYQIKTIPIDTVSLVSNRDYAASCLMENGDLFYSGGYLVSHCYIINPVTTEWKKLPDMPIALYAHTLFQKGNYIYIFGGSISRPVSSCYKYSLKMHEWTEIEHMPCESYSVSCVTAVDCFLLAGQTTSGVLSYKNKEYTKVMGGEMGFSMLLKNEIGDLFYLNNRNVYKSHYIDYENWKLIGNYDYSLHCLLNYPQLFNDTFYFLIYPNQYVSFNYKTLELKLILSLNEIN